MKKLISRISLIGLTPDSPFALRNKLKVFNIAVLAVFLISCFYFVAAFTNAYYLSTWVTVYSIISTLIIWILVYNRKYTFAFHFAMWYGLIFLSAFSYIFGEVTNSYFYFLFLPIACNILFDERREINTYFVITVVVMVTNVYFMDHSTPYYTVEDGERWLGYPNIPFVLLLIFFSVRMFKNENRKYAERIEEQRSVLEEKNKEITDSINYARRIQTALLAPEALLKKNVPDHFILYKPKDIVSGDFYYASGGDDGKFWMCVGDCTGHGVPGAFMSLLNISILRELITEQKIGRPDEVLNRQREQIILALNPDGATVQAKDGMDCALVKFDFERRVFHFSCANNPVLIVRNGALHEFKADKQPVGIHEGVVTPYTLHEWKWEAGDLLYLITDGFADQFGGPKGKKYKYARLKEQLVALANRTAGEQREILDHDFESWRGKLEQVDDVLIIGVRLT